MKLVTKLKVIALVTGVSVVMCAASASEIVFSGVVTSAVGSGFFSPTPIAVGDTFSGFVKFDSSNTVLGSGVVFPASGASTGTNFLPAGFLSPISNGYSFEGFYQVGLSDGGTDSFFAFDLHDTVNTFFASGSGPDPVNPEVIDGENYEGQISHFSVSVPERGGTMLFLAMSLMPLIAARIKRQR
jgi:hypothetical protein